MEDSPPSTINLSHDMIDAALPRICEGLCRYLWLQSRVADKNNFAQDQEFRHRFNRFYRVRRNPAWQESFYGLMARAEREKLRFPAILEALYKATNPNRYEASFASKLVATLDPSQPVIDAVVLKNVGLRLPAFKSENRAARICKVYSELTSLFSAFLASEGGEYLVRGFRASYPMASITKVKMLDLVLWQTRDRSAAGG